MASIFLFSYSLLSLLLDPINVLSYNHQDFIRRRHSYFPDFRCLHSYLLSHSINHADASSCVHVKVVENMDQSKTSFQDIFIQSKSWGRNPVLIRQAFNTEAHELLWTLLNNSTSSKHQQLNNSWPTWEDIKKLASHEDVESRWITHIPKDDSSWSLDLGPFDPEDVDEALATWDYRTNPIMDDENDEDARDDMLRRSTLIVNDVDRFIPSLFYWIDKTFTFIPHWRRDDGQVSLAHQDGGIGPHIDEYDVFLIQMAGTRRWELGKRIISVVEELEDNFLIQGLDVRIIRDWHNEKGEDFILFPGDVLYIPPRIAHCGTAQR